ncbi:MAG TPA: hypothetical protein VJY35_00095, partial [Candidatus Eisenbacteria bacterium]|nr:hypothetical protein [Candidatus Eisenbacteria bacterium]
MLPSLSSRRTPGGSLRPGSILHPLTGRVAAAVVGLALLGLPAIGSAAEPVRALREKQAIRTRQLEIQRPAGIAYAPQADLFIVLPSASATGPAAGRGVAMNKLHEHAGSVDLSGARWNPRAVAYDAARGRLLVL